MKWKRAINNYKKKRDYKRIEKIKRLWILNKKNVTLSREWTNKNKLLLFSLGVAMVWFAQLKVKKKKDGKKRFNKFYKQVNVCNYPQVHANIKLAVLWANQFVWSQQYLCLPLVMCFILTQTKAYPVTEAEKVAVRAESVCSRICERTQGACNT